MPFIEQMDNKQLEDYLSSLVEMARQERDLDIIFGSNGLRGRGATGNYTLISKVTGLHRVHVGRILSGRCNPSLRVIRVIANKTGIGLEEIERYIRAKKEKREAAKRDAA